MVAMNRIEITIHGDRGMNNLPRIEIGDESLFSKTGCHLEILPEMSSLECGCIYEISELRVVLTVSLSIDGEAGGDGRKDKGIAFFYHFLFFSCGLGVVKHQLFTNGSVRISVAYCVGLTCGTMANYWPSFTTRIPSLSSSSSSPPQTIRKPTELSIMSHCRPQRNVSVSEIDEKTNHSTPRTNLMQR